MTSERSICIEKPDPGAVKVVYGTYGSRVVSSAPIFGVLLLYNTVLVAFTMDIFIVLNEHIYCRSLQTAPVL